MKRTTKQPLKALGTPVRLGLLAAVSGIAIVGAAGTLTAQSAGETLNSGGYSTAGIPIGDDVYGAQPVAAGGLQPVGVGPAAGIRTGPIGAQAVGTSRGPKAGTPIRSGRWVTSVSAFAETSVTYSDNINLDPEGFEEDEVVGTVTVGGAWSAQSERITGQISAQASYDSFFDGTNDDGVRGALNTNWSAAVVPNLFYVDVAGGVTEFFDTDGSGFSGNAVANSDERSRAYYGLISPSLRRNLGGWANAELRYTLRGEEFDDNDLDGGYSQTISAGLTGDPRKFRRFGWQAVTEYETYKSENDDDDLNRWTSYVSVDVPVARTIALTATGGYDHFSEDVADDDLSGAFGNVGVRWQPTTRLAARAFGGWRYDGVDYGAEASYALRQNLVAGVSARRGVQFTNFDGDTASPITTVDGSGRTAFVTPGGGTTRNIDDALAIDRLTGQTGRRGDINRTIQDDDAIVDTLQAYVAGQSGRTSWNANVQAARYDYASAFGSDETIIAANASVGRQLTSRLGMDAGIGFTSVQFDDVQGANLDDSDYETLSLGVGLDYQLTEIVNVFGRYTYTTRFADDAQDEFDENAAVVGVRADF